MLSATSGTIGTAVGGVCAVAVGGVGVLNVVMVVDGAADASIGKAVGFAVVGPAVELAEVWAIGAPVVGVVAAVVAGTPVAIGADPVEGGGVGGIPVVGAGLVGAGDGGCGVGG